MRTARGASSATAARGVRGTPRKATPNSRTSARAARPTDTAANAAAPTISHLQTRIADPSRRQQRLEQQPERGKPETGRQHGDREQPDEATPGGDRHPVDQSPQAVEPARAGADLRCAGAPQQQRPAQYMTDQRQPRRLERQRRDRRQIDRARQQRNAECHRLHPEQLQRTAHATVCSVSASAARSDPIAAIAAPVSNNGTPHHIGCPAPQRSNRTRSTRYPAITGLTRLIAPAATRTSSSTAAALQPSGGMARSAANSPTGPQGQMPRSGRPRQRR